MKKLACILGITTLAACANPEVTRPFEGGPTYYKVPQCTRYNVYPKSYREFNQMTGEYDTYITLGQTQQVRCNYNPLLYRPASLNSVYMYGYGE